MRRISRKIALAALAATLVVAACGSDQQTTDDTSALSATTATSASGDGTPGATETAEADTSSSNPSDTNAPTSGDHRGGTLKVGLFYDPVSIDPLGSNGVAERTVVQSIYDSLVEVSPEGELMPGLATEWSTEDGTAWILLLRDDVTFHDGTPFDAEAVKAHFDRLFAPDSGCVSTCAEISMFESAEVLGTHEIQINLSRPSAAFPASLVGFAGMIESPTAVAELGDDFALNPVGTGPFVFAQRTAGTSIIVVRNENYWMPEYPLLDSIEFRPIADVQARYAAVQSGQVDLIHEPGVTEVLQAESDGLRLVRIGALGTKFVMFHTQKAPFDDPEVRRAVALATDTELLNETINSNLYGSTTDPTPAGLWWDAEPANYATYDPEAARAIVEELGGLSFTIDVGLSTDTLMAQALQAMWAEVGIEAEINTLETSVYIQRGLNREFDVSLFSWNGGWDPHLNTTAFFTTDSPRNYTALSDPELDALLEAGLAATEQGERAAIYADVSEKLAELMPYAFLYSSDKFFITQPDVMDVPLLADGVLRTRGVWLDR